MVDFGYVSSRIIWIKFKFSNVKVCVVVGYGSNEEGEEGDRFWNDMDMNLDSVGNGYRLCILGDLNGWIGDRARTGITGAFGVPGENENGRTVVEKGYCVWVTYFKHRGLHKYTRVARGQDGAGVKSMIDLDLVLVMRDIL